MYEVNIIRSFFNKDNYKHYRSFVKEEQFDKAMVPLLRVLDSWHQNNEGDLEPDDFVNYFFGDVRYDLEFYKGVVNNVVSRPAPESTKALLEGFRNKALAERVSVVAYEVSEGKKSEGELLKLLEEIRTPIAVDDQLAFVTDDIEEIVNDVVAVPGLRWRLQTLNTIFGSLRQGDFGFIFARPEMGKTTFIASELTYMAKQVKDNEPPILWFNNEEQGKKVKFKAIQAACGWTKEQVMSNYHKAFDRYKEATNGKLEIIDNAALTKQLIEAYLDRYGCSLAAVDQLDKVYGFKADREDLRMGAVYQWARELAKQYGPVIGVCQADGSAEGIEYLTMANVSNSKTSKSAEADWILGIGGKDSPGFEYVRYLSAIKNKLIGDADTDPSMRHGKREVIIKPQIARYEDIR